MEKAAVKGIPYGVARFDEVRNENFYYVDKTIKYLFLIRPRRFGKSVFVSMMQAYYDIAKADRFDTLFDGLWIKEHPTPLKNAFQVIYFDFSLAGAGMERLEYTFNDYCCTVLDRFIERYQSYYDEKFFEEVQSATDAADKLRSTTISLMSSSVKAARTCSATLPMPAVFTVSISRFSRQCSPASL